MVDAYPWAVGVRLTHLNPSALNDSVSSDASAEDAPGKPWHKRSSLFRAYSHVNSTKRISFTADHELRAVLFYEAPSVEVCVVWIVRGPDPVSHVSLCAECRLAAWYGPCFCGLQHNWR